MAFPLTVNVGRDQAESYISAGDNQLGEVLEAVAQENKAHHPHTV